MLGCAVAKHPALGVGDGDSSARICDSDKSVCSLVKTSSAQKKLPSAAICGLVDGYGCLSFGVLDQVGDIGGSVSSGIVPRINVVNSAPRQVGTKSRCGPDTSTVREMIIASVMGGPGGTGCPASGERDGRSVAVDNDLGR